MGAGCVQRKKRRQIKKSKDETDNSRLFYAYVNWRDERLRPLELEYNRAKTRLETAEKEEREAWNRYAAERKRLSLDYYQTIESENNEKRGN